MFVVKWTQIDGEAELGFPDYASAMNFLVCLTEEAQGCIVQEG